MLRVLLQWLMSAWLLLIGLRWLWGVAGLWRLQRRGALTRLQLHGLVTAQVLGLGCVLAIAFGTYRLVAIPLRGWTLWHGNAALLAVLVAGFVLASLLSHLYYKHVDRRVVRFFLGEPEAVSEAVAGDDPATVEEPSW